jgi:cytidine deaminase
MSLTSTSTIESTNLTDPTTQGENTMKTTTYIALVAFVAAVRNHVIASAYEMADGWLPCIKAKVYAALVMPNGRVYYGANWMTVGGIEICPRVLMGTSSYEPCASICGQGTEFHAERNAMWNAYYSGETSLVGAEMFIVGHVYCCATCTQAMLEEGIVNATSLHSGVTLTRVGDAFIETGTIPTLGTYKML